MRYSTYLPSSVSRDFRDRVRRECEKAAINGEPIGYEELAEAVIGDADRGSQDRRFIRLADKALCENMRDDVKAGRPLSAVVVQPVGNTVPGDYFFIWAWELDRFTGDEDPAEFVAREWAAYRQSLGLDDYADDLALAIAA